DLPVQRLSDRARRAASRASAWRLLLRDLGCWSSANTATHHGRSSPTKIHRLAATSVCSVDRYGTLHPRGRQNPRRAQAPTGPADARSSFMFLFTLTGG